MFFVKDIYQIIRSSATGVALFLILTLTCCENIEKDSVVFNIIPEANLEGVVLYVADTTGFVKIFESDIHSSDDVSFKRKANHPFIYSIEQGDKRIEVIASPGDKLVVDLKNRTVHWKRGEENLHYTAFAGKIKDNDNRLDSLFTELIYGQSTDDYQKYREVVTNDLNSITVTMNAESKKFISDNPSSIGIFRAINLSFKQKPVFNYLLDKPVYNKVDSLFSLYHNGHPYSTWFRKRLRNIEKISAEVVKTVNIPFDSQFPEFALRNFNGKEQQLSVDKGGLTVIYLWNDNTRSRQATQRLKSIYDSYRDKKLNVFAISFDNSLKNWGSIITIDKMWWINVIDTTGNRSSLLKELDSPPVPYFIVVDDSHKVKAHFSNSVQLEAWLKTYYLNQE